MRAVMVSGAVGIAGLLAAIEPLEQSRDRIFDEQRLAADRQLADAARGVIRDDDGRPVGTGPLPTPEDIRLLSRVLVAYLDPDGAEPADAAGARARSLFIGRERNGGVPIRGNLLPEVAGQLLQLQDSILNPRVDGPADPTTGVHFAENPTGELTPDGESYSTAQADDRTRAQKLHDAFAMIVNAAARSGEFPDIGGAAPTLVVTVTAEDYASGTGWATVLNTGDRIPSRVAAQTGCAGGIQRVLFDENGRIAALGTSARIFNAIQRRAITLRDGGCIIPGCTVPASWCEIHHVTEYADGGPTHTDNGVLLCWWHHRNLHLSEWHIRMNRGIPEVRGPEWWDCDQLWHPAGVPRIRERAG
jgi:hypothetical protein